MKKYQFAYSAPFQTPAKKGESSTATPVSHQKNAPKAEGASASVKKQRVSPPPPPVRVVTLKPPGPQVMRLTRNSYLQPWPFSVCENRFPLVVETVAQSHLPLGVKLFPGDVIIMINGATPKSIEHGHKLLSEQAVTLVLTITRKPRILPPTEAAVNPEVVNRSVADPGSFSHIPITTNFPVTPFSPCAVLERKSLCPEGDEQLFSSALISKALAHVAEVAQAEAAGLCWPTPKRPVAAPVPRSRTADEVSGVVLSLTAKREKNAATSAASLLPISTTCLSAILDATKTGEKVSWEDRAPAEENVDFEKRKRERGEWGGTGGGGEGSGGKHSKLRRHESGGHGRSGDTDAAGLVSKMLSNLLHQPSY